MNLTAVIVANVLAQVVFSWHGRRYPRASMFRLDGFRALRDELRREL